MHPYVLIPLLAAAGSAGLASAIIAREPGPRANRLVAGLLACTAGWSLCEVLWTTARDPSLAVILARASSLGSLMLAPLSLHLMRVLLPDLGERFRPLLRLSYATTALFVAANVSTSWYADAMIRTGWGWTPALGPLVPVEYAIVAACPLFALAHWLLRIGARDALRALPWPAIAAPALPLCVASLTDFAFPLAGIQAPRLGSISLAAWGALTWWTVYRYREPVIAPRRFAREILSTLPEGVILLRLDGRIRVCNEKLGALAGCPARELMGAPIQELLRASAATPDCPLDDRECDLLPRSGGRVPVEVSRATLRDDEGSAAGFVLVIRDLREVVSLRSRLITSGRLAAVGQLATGITHEINNPIAYVRSNAALLERHWETICDALEKASRDPALRETRDEGRELLHDARDGIERVAAIVRDVGGFSRTGPQTRELEDVNRLLDTAARVAAPQLRGRATVERDYGEVPAVACVPQELMQVFLNLLLNAGQALDGPGTIRLITRARGGDVCVQIADDGPGMSREVRERIFDAFFTTKPAGEGTGLGLAISRQIVVRHGGRIDVESRVGAGTRFEIRLPAAREGAS